MVAKMPNNDEEPPEIDPVIDRAKTERLEKQLHHSRLQRDEVETKRERAEETASSIARSLRALASAMDRNPQSWDALLGGE